MKNTAVMFLLLLVLASCSKVDEPNDEKADVDLMEGVWVNTQFVDTAYVISRGVEFVEDQDGFEIKSDGTFVYRTSSSWCGTPMIYANYPGTWTSFPDNTIFVETEYWGGHTSFNIEIISVDEEKMVYKYHQSLN